MAFALQPLAYGPCLTRVTCIFQFIEYQQTARQQPVFNRLKGCLRRLGKRHIETAQRNNRLGMFIHVGPDGLAGIPFDEVVFHGMAHRIFATMIGHQLCEVVLIVQGGSVAIILRCFRALVCVVDAFVAFKRIETDQCPRRVLGFQHGPRGFEYDHVLAQPSAKDIHRNIQDGFVTFI